MKLIDILMKGGDENVKIILIVILLLNMIVILLQYIEIKTLENKLQQAYNDTIKELNKK